MTTAADLTPYGRMARAFQIFDAYDNGDEQGINAQHNELWAGPDPTRVDPGHIEELADLGWHASHENDSFWHNT